MIYPVVKRISEIKNEAKISLKGKRLVTAFFFLTALIIYCGIGYLLEFVPMNNMVLKAVDGGIFVFLIYPFFCGFVKYFYQISTGVKAKYKELFSCFDNSLMTCVYVAFFIFVADYAVTYIDLKLFEVLTLNFVASIVYFVLKYLLLVFGLFSAAVIADNPFIDAREVFAKTSAFAAKGFFKTFKLMLSFILWLLLVFLTFGIASLFVVPYFMTSFGRLFDNIKHSVEGVAEYVRNDEKEIIEEPVIKEEPKSADDDITEDLSALKETETVEKDEPKTDETIIFTKEMISEIKKNQQKDENI